MTDLPAPLTPPDCDLRGLPSFMLNTERLLSSEIWALSTGEEFKAAMALWMRAWQSVPAASLPDDDKRLAALSGAGSRWKKVKEVALRGFIKCSDGRIYHKTLAEDALRAHENQQRYKARAKVAADKRWSDEKSNEINESSMLVASPKNRPSISSSIGQALLEDGSKHPQIQIQEQSITNVIDKNIHHVSEKREKAKAEKPDDVTDDTWRDFQALRKAHKAPLSPTALKTIRSEAMLANMSLEKALQTCCARGWRSFKAEWITKDQSKRTAQNPFTKLFHGETYE